MKRICAEATAGAALLAMSAYKPEQAAVLQLDDNKIKAVGAGYSEKSSFESAISTANERCAQQDKEAFVLASDTGCQGVDKNTALIVYVLTAAAQNSGRARLLSKLKRFRRPADDARSAVRPSAQVIR
ncbi:hypothetical protein GS610_09430 [Ruegeria sp. HKCCD6228]|uniref:hypothetical protein n=1 Tax=Ruegeria sp. HKCCD6228 TaxID=2683001 RepID=UPI0014909AFD|nr:hypothetical protein [Ruegeria sp. HKCCD6228]NOD97431.1 hypothetical protein [Ruegeria sp. HKCCD6228]